MNNALHTTTFHVWWDHLDGGSGKMVRSEKVFRKKEEAALFIRKQPHILRRLNAAGCYMLVESKETFRDGKTRQTTIKEDVWTYQELLKLVEA
jgi:hypothetical protein